MKIRPLSLLLGVLLALGATAAHAQWQSVTYTLRGGWNSIYLHGDLPQGDVNQIFAAYPDVLEVWRWNPNPGQTQFDVSPLIPTAGLAEWSRWQRSAPAEATLTQLTGQSGYLVRCAGAASASYSVQLAQKPRPPASVWVRNGASFLGFPSRQNGNYPLFSAYFSTFPTAIAASTKIYKYVGGDLGPANPVQIFSPSLERLDRNQAYWFDAQVVSGFHAPVEITPTPAAGLHFGRSGSVVTLRLRNRSSSSATLTLAPVDSAAAPAGQTQISGRVPLTRRVFNSSTAQWAETPIAGPYSETLGPLASVELSFGLDRSSLSGAPGAFFASFLRLTDSGNLFDAMLPASASVDTLAGLWLGDIEVGGVASLAPGSPGSTTARPFPLRAIFHVDDNGVARMLSQVYVGQLAAPSNPIGLCVRESALLASAKDSANRYSAAHLPPDTEIATGSGAFAPGSTLVRTVIIPFNAGTNPFVHEYHPDHDNLDARLQPVGEGVESYTVQRECRFTFAATPPAGVSSVGWGSSVVGGTYQETLTGLHRQPLVVTGNFLLRRVSEIGSITLP